MSIVMSSLIKEDDGVIIGLKSLTFTQYMIICLNISLSLEFQVFKHALIKRSNVSIK